MPSRGDAPSGIVNIVELRHQFTYKYTNYFSGQTELTQIFFQVQMY